MKPYPIFLVGLNARHCIVIGGGREAERKVQDLLDCDATVTVISPELTPQLQVWSEAGAFTWLKRGYESGDLRGAFLVIAEYGDKKTSALIADEAEKEGALVNVMDDAERCNFAFGSTCRQGALVISISTSGAAPTVSVRLRERFQKEFGAEYAEFLNLMQALRAPMAEHVHPFSERRKRWYELVDSNVLDLLRAGKRAQAFERIEEIVGEAVAGSVRGELR
jgi:siroheme synthase-like protein